MSITWISESSARFVGAFVALRGYRTPEGSIRLYVRFSPLAVERLNLQGGERVVYGLDAELQRIAFKPTLYGGYALCSRAVRRDMFTQVTLPFMNMPPPQFVLEDQVELQGDVVSMPFEFDTSEFKGWKRATALRVAA